jgi:hypothetical protein
VDAPITAAVDSTGAIEADWARLRIGKFDERQPIGPKTRSVTFHVDLPAGSTRLETWLKAKDGKSCGAYYVELLYVTR